MQNTSKATQSEWKEGKVDRNAEHMKLYWGEWGDSTRPVALVAKPCGSTFLVEFLEVPGLGENEEQQAKLAAIRELTFYLVEKNEQDPWKYAIYHCGTSSNFYSDVHWGYFPEGEK